MMIRRFGMVAAMGLMAVYMQEAGEGGEPGAGTGPEVETGGKATTQVEVKTPPAAEQVPEPVKGATEALDKAGFAAVDDDPGLTYTLGFLAQNGFNSETPSVVKALQGDFSLLKAELAQKGAAGWEQAIGLAEQSYERHVAELDATAAKVADIVTGFAEQQGVDWEQAVQHVSSTANDDEKAAINQLLSDPKTAHIAAGYITNSFMQGSDTEVQPQVKATSTGGQPTGQPGAGQPLTRREYAAELGKLQKSLGEDYLNSPQAKALYRRLKT